jgi:hypothetical protein
LPKLASIFSALLLDRAILYLIFRSRRLQAALDQIHILLRLLVFRFSIWREVVRFKGVWRSVVMAECPSVLPKVNQKLQDQRKRETNRLKGRAANCIMDVVVQR